MTDRKHNGGPSFDDIVRDSLDRDLWYEVSKSSSRAMQDLRLTRFQLHILGALIDFLNPETGTAFPGRKTLAEKTGYSEGAVANAISALIGFGYVISARRQSQPGARALAHYAITRPSVEEYQAAIEKHLADRGLKSKPGWRPQWEADVTPVDDVRKADVITVGDVMKANVTPVGDVRTVANVINGHDISANGTPVGDVRKADVTNGHGQYSKKEEVSKKESNNIPTHTEVVAARDGAGEGPRLGEDEVYPGVYVNCETVRHSKFVISLEALSMQLGLSSVGIPRDQIKDLARKHAIAAAVDWAEQLKVGKRPPIDNPVNVIRGKIVKQYQTELTEQYRRESAQKTEPYRSSGFPRSSPALGRDGKRATTSDELKEAAWELLQEQEARREGKWEVRS